MKSLNLTAEEYKIRKAAHAKIYNKINKDAINARKRNYYANNKSKYKAYSKKYNSNRTFKATIAQNRKSVEKQRKLKFGVTPDVYQSMLIKQNYRCAICQVHRDDLTRDFCIDHNHTTNKVRGLLCHACNSGLGFLNDSTMVLLNSIEYLNKSL